MATSSVIGYTSRDGTKDVFLLGKLKTAYTYNEVN